MKLNLNLVITINGKATIEENSTKAFAYNGSSDNRETKSVRTGSFENLEIGLKMDTEIDCTLAELCQAIAGSIKSSVEQHVTAEEKPEVDLEQVRINAEADIDILRSDDVSREDKKDARNRLAALMRSNTSKHLGKGFQEEILSEINE